MNKSKYGIPELIAKLNDNNCDFDNFNKETKVCSYRCRLHPDQEQSKKVNEMFRIRTKWFCKYCMREDSSIKQREFANEEELKELFAERNMILLPNQKYYHNRQKLRYICTFHQHLGEQQITWSKFRIGQGCHHCGITSTSNKLKKYSLTQVKEIFEKENCILLSTEFKTVDHSLEFICENGHFVRNSLYSFLKGRYCWDCGVEKRSGENHYLWNMGSSEIYRFLRSSIKQWVSDSLKLHNYSCVLSGSHKNLHVHHANINFIELAKQLLKKYDISINKTIGEIPREILMSVSQEFLQLHYDYGLGYPLREDIHFLFHSLYGKYQNTFEQFLEFKTRFENGEFEMNLREENVKDDN